MHWLTAFPVATISTALFYLLLASLVFPRSRAMVAPLFVHPLPPHQQYQRGFDAVRGFAACFVAVGHCWWSTYPVFGATQLAFPFIQFTTKGVPIFAVLSGFLIYRSVLGITSLGDLRAYAIRRFFRIYPVYVTGVLICLCLGQYVATDPVTGPGFLVADLFMFQIFDWGDLYGNPPTWSVYVEVAFYGFLPIAVLTLRRDKMLIVALLGIVALIIGDYPSRVFGLWKYFLIGIVASEATPYLRRSALPLFAAGAAMFIIDLRGSSYDWAARLGFGIQHVDGETVGLGLAWGLMLAALPHLARTSKALNVLPLRLVGVISYSVYIMQFFYIRANFPEIELFTKLGTTQMYDHFKTLPSYPAWYLPIIFFPGILLWGAMSFLVIEKPAIRFGQWLTQRSREAEPLQTDAL